MHFCIFVCVSSRSSKSFAYFVSSVHDRSKVWITAWKQLQFSFAWCNCFHKVYSNTFCCFDVLVPSNVPVSSGLLSRLGATCPHFLSAPRQAACPRCSVNWSWFLFVYFFYGHTCPFFHRIIQEGTADPASLSTIRWSLFCFRFLSICAYDRQGDDKRNKLRHWR